MAAIEALVFFSACVSIKKSQAASFAKITRTGAGKEKENATISYESVLDKLSFNSPRKCKKWQNDTFQQSIKKGAGSPNGAVSRRRLGGGGTVLLGELDLRRNSNVNSFHTTIPHTKTNADYVLKTFREKNLKWNKTRTKTTMTTEAAATAVAAAKRTRTTTTTTTIAAAPPPPTSSSSPPPPPPTTTTTTTATVTTTTTTTTTPSYLAYDCLHLSKVQVAVLVVPRVVPGAVVSAQAILIV